jgi:hypothetical protein
MSYDAKVLEIIIASPSDVVREREVVREVIADWNAVNAREREIVLLPLGWDSHSSPELGTRPHQLINDRVLSRADLLVGIFWTRVGSPTGNAVSGTVEEIEEHVRANKPAMLYFSRVSIPPDQIDRGQHESLERFRSWAVAQGLVEVFNDLEELRKKFSRQLPITLQTNPYLRNLLPELANAGAPPAESLTAISEGPRQLLIEASSSSDGSIIVRDTIKGYQIRTNGKQFVQDSPQSSAQWMAAVDALLSAGLIRDKDGSGRIYLMTDTGYRAAKMLGRIGP